MKRRKLLFSLALAAIVVAIGYTQFGTHNTPAGQPPLAYLDPTSLGALKTDFNRAAGETRLIVLLAPT